MRALPKRGSLCPTIIQMHPRLRGGLGRLFFLSKREIRILPRCHYTPRSPQTTKHSKGSPDGTRTGTATPTAALAPPLPAEPRRHTKGPAVGRSRPLPPSPSTPHSSRSARGGGSSGSAEVVPSPGPGPAPTHQARLGAGVL